MMKNLICAILMFYTSYTFADVPNEVLKEWRGRAAEVERATGFDRGYDLGDGEDTVKSELLIPYSHDLLHTTFNILNLVKELKSKNLDLDWRDCRVSVSGDKDYFAIELVNISQNNPNKNIPGVLKLTFSSQFVSSTKEWGGAEGLRLNVYDEWDQENQYVRSEYSYNLNLNQDLATGKSNHLSVSIGSNGKVLSISMQQRDPRSPIGNKEANPSIFCDGY